MFNFFGGSKKPQKDDIKSRKGVKEDKNSNYNPFDNNKPNIITENIMGNADYSDDDINITEDDFNDPQLMAELQKYRNQDECESNKKMSTISPKKHLNPSIYNKAESINLIDMNSAVDPDNVEITEDDLKDPELLAELTKYEDLSGKSVKIEGENEIHLNTEVYHGTELSATPPTGLEISTEIIQPDTFPAQLSIQTACDTQNISTSLITNSAVPTSLTYPLVEDITINCTPEIAKQNAKLCMKAGATEEALEWMRKAKTLGVQNSASLQLSSQPRVPQPKQSAATAVATAMSKFVPVSTSAGVTKNPAQAGAETKMSIAPLRSPANSSKVTSSVTTVSPKPIVTPGNKSSNANLVPVASPPVSNPLAGPAVAGGTLPDIFTPLELALQESSTHTLALAKEFKTSHQNSKAIEKMKLYKEYQQELTVLNSRRQVPGARPPLFRWEEKKKEIKIEHVYLGDDQIELSILSLDGIQATLDAHTARSLSITYTIPTGKDTQATGNSNIVTYKDGKAEFSFKVLIDMNRQKSLINLFSRKKASFQINLHRGLFSSAVVLGAAALPLADLLTHCSCGGNIPLLKEEGSKKAIGGLLQACLRLRRPLDRPEVAYETEKELVVGPWPEVVVVDASCFASAALLSPSFQTPMMTSPLSQTPVMTSPLSQTPMMTSPLSQTPVMTSPLTQTPVMTSPLTQTSLMTSPLSQTSDISYIATKNDDPVVTAAIPHSPTNTPNENPSQPNGSTTSSSTTPSSNKNATLTKQMGDNSFPHVSEAEKEDPLSLDFIVSNDVLEAEMTNIDSYLATHKKTLSEDELSQLQTRRMLAELKLNALVTQVSDESITFKEYLEIVKVRHSRDIQLCAYCKSTNMIKEARSIFERIKITKAEIEGAEKSLREDDAT